MKKKIMVVDDDPAVLKTITKLLERLNFPVVSADSGSACIELCEAGFTGLVLMDVMMPGMDGWETIQELVDRNLIDNTLICMLTGEETPSPKMDRLKEYVVDYITKPFDVRQLTSIIKDSTEYLS